MGWGVRGVRRSLEKKYVFRFLMQTSSMNFSLYQRMQNRERNRLVAFSSKMDVSIKSYSQKTIPRQFTVGNTENWRENKVFPDLRAIEIETQKSKENHIWQIRRAFEWTIGHRPGWSGRGENRERTKKKQSDKKNGYLFV